MPTYGTDRGTNRVDTSTDVVYEDDELEFLRAVERWKKENRRQYPTCCDILKIAKSLGYCKGVSVTAACPRCDGDGKAHGSDRPFEYNGPGTYPGPCPECKGLGTIVLEPTDPVPEPKHHVHRPTTAPT